MTVLDELAQIATPLHDAQALGAASAQTILAFVVLVLLSVCGWLAIDNRRLNRELVTVQRELLKEAVAREADVSRAVVAIEGVPAAVEALGERMRAESERLYDAVARLTRESHDTGSNATRRPSR